MEDLAIIDISWHHTVVKIVSLVPSWTETLFTIGAGSSVAGVTRYCIRPSKVDSLPRMGGTKDPDLAAIDRLEPDLVILCGEENRREDAEYLMGRYDIFLTDPRTVEDVVRDIRTLGRILDLTPKAEELASSMEDRSAETEGVVHGTFACLIWKEPLMCVGGGRYASGLLTHLGLSNVFAGRIGYPAITGDDLHTGDADLILLPDEPYPWTEEDQERDFSSLRGSCRLLPGDLVTWHGAATLRGLKELPRILS